MNNCRFVPTVLAVISLVLFTEVAHGQLQLVRDDAVTVTASGSRLALPWAGGLNSPQFSEIDLNGDGLKDLFVMERNFNGVVKTFVNGGTQDSIDYNHEPFYQSAFPVMRNWALLADYNCDGREDIFTSVPFGIAVYRNDYTETTGLKFTQVANLLRTNTSEGEEFLYVPPPDIPAITDIDNDGDLDILTFDILGKYVEYHQNQSMEVNNDCNELVFELKSRCWGYFSENETNNGINLYDTCTGNQNTQRQGGRHAGSTLLAHDLTGDQVKDLLIGDIAHDNLVELINGGVSGHAVMVSVDTAFPSSFPVDLTTYPAAFLADVNNDQLTDLLVAPNNPNTSVNTHSAWIYENTGTQVIPEFSYRGDSFLQEEMIDVGEGARPVFFDANADGLHDIVIGNFGYFTGPGNYQSKLTLLQHAGTVSSPSFEVMTDDYAGLSSYEFFGVYPAFGDLDNDGDLDMVTGDEEGRLHLFTNTAEQGNPAEFVLSGPNYQGIDVGQTAMPQVADVDGDGLPDLLVGERSGTINYFRNTGSAGQPAFDALPTNDFFGGIDVMEECCTGYSSTYMTKDSTGQTVMYVGSERGILYLYNNIDDNLEGNFILVDSLDLYGLNVNVSGADLYNNGREELVYGEYAGGIALLKRGKPSYLDVAETAGPEIRIGVYPNPAYTLLHVTFDNPREGTACRMILSDLYGRLMETLTVTDDQKKFTLDVSAFPAGIYLLRIAPDLGKPVTKKIIIR